MSTTTASVPATTVSGIYVNLPVADLQRSIAFFSALGFTFNAQFTDDTATCLVLGPNMCAMLLTHEKFKGFAPKGMVDGHESNEVLTCLGLESRAQVEDLVRRAVAAGARTYREPADHGFMYWHGFQDLDGHVWELMYMDEAAFARAQAGG